MTWYKGMCGDGRQRVSRFIRVAALVGASWGLADPALGETLTEREIISLVAALDPTVTVAQKRASLTASQELQAGLLPNPELGWEREHYPSAGADSELEDTIALSVPLELSSRTSTAVELARSDSAMAHAEALHAQRQATVRAVSLYYTLLALRERTHIEARTVATLQETVRVVKSRSEQALASGYELARVEVEAELAASRHREALADAQRLHLQLARQLTRAPEKVEFAGELKLPSALPHDLKHSSTVSASASCVGPDCGHAVAPPALQALRQAQSSAAQAVEGSGRAWVPPLSLSAGLRLDSSGDVRRYGYVAGVSIGIPLFSRAQASREQARAKLEYVQAEVAMATRDRLTRLETDLHTMRTAYQEAVQFEQTLGDRLLRVERAAQAGYQEGVHSLTELMDATQLRVAADQRRVELRLAFKLAELGWRAAQGEFE